jgi:HlyD family secretion protein
MDKTLEKQGWSVRQWIALGVASLLVVGIAWAFMSRTRGTRLAIDPERMTTAVVQRGEFLEYYPFDGTVEPATTVYLDVEGGGRVDAIYVEGGQHVEKGDLLLRFSNAALQRTAIDTETQLLYNLDIQRNTQFNRAQSTSLLKEALLDLDHQILDMQNKYRRYDTLMKKGNAALSVEEFETTRNQLQYLQDKRTLMAERIQREDELSTQQIAQVRHSIERLNTSMDLLNRIVKSLEVRAPITGDLSTIEAEVGQNINQGQRIGQIDVPDKFKVRVRIDQFYISRVALGTSGRIELDGRSWNVKVQKIYPEVRDNAFGADVTFSGGTPESIKRGQTVTVELTFGAPTRSLTVAKGGFFQETAGRWVYLLAKDGHSAHRTPVHLGKQNPRAVEVLEGLHEGDRIITSSYETYNAVDELQFK